MPKEKKPRAAQYDPKLAIKGSFMDVIKLSVGKPLDKPKKVSKKKK